MPRVPENVQKERRERLVVTAARMFLNKGYDHTTIDAIVNELGLAKGTFYYHFKSKTDLVVAVCENIVSGLETRLKTICDQTDRDVVDRIRAAMEVLYDAFYENRDIWYFIYQENNLVLYDRLIRTNIRKLAPFFADMLTEGAERGLFAVPHVMEAAELIIALHDFHVKQYFNTEDPRRRKRGRETLESVIDLMLSAGEK